MSQAASQAAAFYRNVAKNKRMWTLHHAEGYILYGEMGVLPCWSTLSRAQKMIKILKVPEGTTYVELSWEEFRDEHAPKLLKGGHKIGVNWSGPRAVGYDIEPDRLVETIQVHIDNEYF